MTNQFGTNLRQAMKERGVSTGALASELYVADVTVSRYLSGKRSPSLETVVRISEILGISTDRLLKGRDAVPSGTKRYVLTFSGEYTIEDISDK